LKEYDVKKKMEMGVFYTPRPVVQFIVRAVDSILKNEFGLERGLADTTKISVDKKEINSKGKEVRVQREYHKVQVLDVATGTGTFLNEIINHIHENFAGQQGRWPAYVEKELLPRLHGFELMMASYTIAHLKLGMTLHDTGAGKIDTRLGVYLTNTLDEPKSSIWGDGSLFVGVQESITKEAVEASRVKSEYPIMCVVGNPPYSGESMNPHYTDNDRYKVEPGGKQKLQERNSKWINDDYVKFIRFAESLIEKNGEGIIGMITAHGYIDNPTFRGMRWHLRKTFDKIYVIDLHGNSRKKETSLDGSKDENVFDIMSGVSIILAIKKIDKLNKELATIFVHDLYGARDIKFENLYNSNIDTINWDQLPESCDVWKMEGKNKDEYNEGFSVNDLFITSSVGIVTGHDGVVVSGDREQLKTSVITYADSDKFEYEENKVNNVNYRPFDTRYIYYDKKFIERGRWDVMQHFINKENIGLIFKRGGIDNNSAPVFISGHISESRSWSRPGMQGIESTAPLYLFTDQGEKIPNLNKEIWQKIDEIVGKTTPESILDYIYAYLHSPNYRKKYQEFLKTDFPRVPYPKNKEDFWGLVPLGEKLRGLHLMSSAECHKLITTFPEAGSDIVEKIKYENNRVYINSTQYFGEVPDVAWNFYIGGYQPAQKWLKDRKGKKLSSEDIEHYQRIIVVLFKTDQIMKEIENIS